MKVTFNLPIKAFSVNATYGNNRTYKTAPFKDWERQVAELLEEIKDLSDLALEFERIGGEFYVSMDFIYPHHIYFNKSKEISAKTFDLSNVEKPLLDQIFGNRMQVNDRFVTLLRSTKTAGAMHEIRVTIELIPA